MRGYYELHAKIYDLTRWTFLFGRHSIIQRLAEQMPNPTQILEVGCGTGYNLRSLAKQFPTAQITGLDVSASMIAKANKNTQKIQDRVQLLEQAYQLGATQFVETFDIVLFSYSLTMINPHWSELIEQASRDLNAGGIIGFVDFYDSRFDWFKRHMGNNHVRMDGHLNPEFKKYFKTEHERIKGAYGGVWQYSEFVGRK